MTLKKKALENIVGNSIFSFSHSVFWSMKEKIVMLVTFNLLSANAFKLVTPKIFSFGNELKNILANMECFGHLFKNWKKMSWTCNVLCILGARSS